MRKNSFTLLQIVMAVILITGITFAQYDDPTLDQIPQALRDVNNPYVYVPYAIITIDDYDNYIMGTTYSEGHISINPFNPLQFFTGWNINVAFYVHNGVDWIQTPVSFPNAAGDPVTAVDSLGNLYYETMKSPISGCWVAKSTNFGQSWLFTNVTAVSGNDKNWITADMTAGPYSNYVYSIMTSGSSA